MKNNNERLTNEGSDAFTDKFQEGSLANRDITEEFFGLVDDYDMSGKRVKK